MHEYHIIAMCNGHRSIVMFLTFVLQLKFRNRLPNMYVSDIKIGDNYKMTNSVSLHVSCCISSLSFAWQISRFHSLNFVVSFYFPIVVIVSNISYFNSLFILYCSKIHCILWHTYLYRPSWIMWVTYKCTSTSYCCYFDSLHIKWRALQKYLSSHDQKLQLSLSTCLGISLDCILSNCLVKYI